MLKRKKIYVVALLCLLPLLSQAQTAVSQQLDGLLQSYQTYQATFKEVVYSNRQRIISQTAGKVMMKRPKMFRWESYQPSHQIVLTNGILLWNYNVDLMQASEQKLPTGDALNAATLLTGNGRQLLAQFDVKLLPQTKLGQVYQLMPKKENKNFSWIKLQFNHKGILVQMYLLNNLDQLTGFYFENIQLNKAISNTLFNFKPDPGVDVVRQ
jgi:outer membrane lipoprotein carrier protein